MQNFHEHKLWQTSFVALMDIHDVIDGLDTDDYEEVVEALQEAARDVTAKIADGLSRKDQRIGKTLIYDTIGLVAVTRTQLAIAWGRGLLEDEVFKKLDTNYAGLSEALQNFR